MFTSFTAKRLLKEGIVALFYLGCLAALPNLLISNSDTFIYLNAYTMK